MSDVENDAKFLFPPNILVGTEEHKMTDEDRLM